MVIVTSNHYLLAKSISHIVLDESVDYTDVRTKSGRYASVPRARYDIYITYTPEHTQRADETRECVIRLTSKAHAHAVYKDLVNQIREQLPDQAFLNSIVDSILNQYDPEALSLKENQEILAFKEALDDAQPTKIRSSRKKKRRNQKVLRRSKTSSRRSK